MIVVFLVGVKLVEVSGEKNCPVPGFMLYAYTDGERYRFRYDFDPLIETSIDIVDQLFQKEVVCDWAVRAKDDHTAIVQIEDFRLTTATGKRHGDCLRIYDGKTAQDKLVGELCGGDISPNEVRRYNATGRYMFVVYLQGEVTGVRSFNLYYLAAPKTKAMVLKIAGIVCGSVAAAAVIFLIFKFTHSCRPCRHRFCPNQPLEEGRTQRELRPLSPVVVPPAGSHGAGPRGGEATVVVGQGTPHDGGDGDDGELSIPADEPPPSYDSIFCTGDDLNKEN
ncbi:hypothetical protein ACOMHN_052005 [Nucella lapillus]